jgi:dCTP deaminase
MVINGDQLLMLSPIKDMKSEKCREFGVSHGLVEVGYDIRIKQEVLFVPGIPLIWMADGTPLNVQTSSEIFIFDGDLVQHHYGSFVLASTIEEFMMPEEVVGIVHDKSTWARQGLSVFNTVIEPGWKGFLTLELAFKGQEPVHIPAGAGIAQVLVHTTAAAAVYDGKYQHQEDYPVAPIYA